MRSSEVSAARFDTAYREHGMSSQRTYPNEQLITFVAQNWFGLPAAQRRAIRILEVGCGSGANLWMLAKEGFAVYGLDSSRAGLDLARRHLSDKWGVEADLTEGSMTALPYDSGFFDGVVDVVSLQHLGLADSAAALAEIRRVLKPGGKFFSYRLSDRSAMYLNSGGRFIDPVTVDNIADRNMPLSNCGPTSFWSPALASKQYGACEFDVEAIDTCRRTYRSGLLLVEYLAITAQKP